MKVPSLNQVTYMSLLKYFKSTNYIDKTANLWMILEKLLKLVYSLVES